MQVEAKTMRTAAVVVMLALPGVVAAQDAGIAGTVTDDTGGVLPGVTVEAAGPALPAPGLAFTDGDGRYALTGLPAGSYTLTFSLPGFERLEREALLEEGAALVVDASLRLGGLFEEVTVAVTGTAIEAPAINMPHAVTLVSRETLERQGATQLVDLMKNLSQSHGVIGERNSWYNSNQPATLTENVANVNLRGLGASRTLVLINGRRHVSVPARLIGGRFVDVNTIPGIAVGRLEVLKEGASATYGSDAVGGVANFVTRQDFRGFEVNVSQESFAGAGDTTVAGIWGGRVGESSLVFSAERVGRQGLQFNERDYLLERFSPHVSGNRAGWSSLGNPGTFSVGGPVPFTADVFDPRCADLGGQPDPDPSMGTPWTCRFRYAPYDNLVEEQDQTRAFVELNGPVNERTDYHLEGLWADAAIPGWYTTPSYPPFTVTSTTIQQVAPDHPGRAAFCGQYAGDALADPGGACANDADWYFNGRPFGNSGPARTLRRESRTWRVAGSLDGDFQMGGRDANWDVGVTYARARGNLNLPAVYTDRMFRAFRGFGGPNCGVGVTADPASPAGMALGPLNGARPGVGDCLYYNPFSSAIQYADQQPGARFSTAANANPDYRADLANDPALRMWLNEEVDLVSTTDLFVADATVSGNLVPNVADFAVGYQYRSTSADGDPNDAGDVTMNPCPVAGDLGCSAGDRFGPYLFTNVHRPYAAEQRLQRVFGELALAAGPRLDTQIAANYEFYNVAGRTVSSFDPKVGARLQAAENQHFSLSFRGSVQTTFRTPSLDDLNTSPLTTLEWIGETGAYQAVDRYGSPDLRPERAFTYNTGVVLFLEGGVEATVDFWSYDFENVIGSMPYDAVTSLYSNPATQDAVAPHIICAGGVASELAPADRCPAAALERVQIDLVNWPGLTTSGIDTHFAARTDAGPGQFSASWDTTYTVGYETKELTLAGTDLTLYGERETAGYLNFAHPISVPLPRWKSRWSATYLWSDYTLANYVNYISSYRDRGANTTVPVIDPFLTWDLSFSWRFPGSGINLSLYALNLTDERPPWANVETGYDGFTHDPKGRRLKVGLTYRFGG